jgi:hypothetical protein
MPPLILERAVVVDLLQVLTAVPVVVLWSGMYEY